MTRLTDLDVKRFSRKYWPRFRENFRENGVENFRENCSKIVKFFRKWAKMFAKFSRKSSFAIFVGNPNPNLCIIRICIYSPISLAEFVELAQNILQNCLKLFILSTWPFHCYKKSMIWGFLCHSMRNTHI